MPSAPNLRTNVLLRSEESDGHVSLIENVVPPHSAGPPLHRHDFDEAFYPPGAADLPGRRRARHQGRR